MMPPSSGPPTFDPFEDPRLRADLSRLAEEGREDPGALPTAEELLAYRDGSLDAAEAERVGRWLGTDAELASLYLDLDAQARDEPLEPSAAAAAPFDHDSGWAEVLARTGAGSPEIAAAPRHRTLLAAAATLLLALAATWLLRSGPALPEGIYHPVPMEGTVYREARQLEVPEDAVGLELRIARELLVGEGPWRLELEDSEGRLLHSGEKEAPAAASGDLAWKVPLGALPQGRPVALEVREASAPGSEPLLREVFRIPEGR